jgi:hypothetical protein
MVSFVYEALQNGTIQSQKMILPFLTLCPIPFIEISHILVDFNVKLTGINSR